MSEKDSNNNSAASSSQSQSGTQQPAQPVQPPREFINVNTSQNSLLNKGLDSQPITKSDSKS